ncbi:hypothetical protein HPP92_007219 [Vanilla planifolia]|uniref:Cupin type-1 domain-containing protein n=1 Tax=Vanilla planifolia TaxID=51239 RepID=A0A835RDP2_VANPL|nr:hypothetical protein HPP92_007219 [Vanilla planifolia]
MAFSLSQFRCLLFLLFLPLCSPTQEAFWQRSFRFRQQECRIERLHALHPRQRLESEAGVTEYFDDNDQQLICAGVTVIRRTLRPRGLILPTFSNSPGLVYILEGSGLTGLLVPGCPETFQSLGKEGGREQSQPFGDEHQKVHHFRKGDMIAIPAGIAHWCYNSGDSPVVAIMVLDTSSSLNQLDSSHRQFLLAGSKQKGGSRAKYGGQEFSGSHFFRAFDTRLLAQALGIPVELAQKIQKEDPRGEMVMVREELKILHPRSREVERERYGGEEEYEREREEFRWHGNGLEQAFCAYRFQENIDDPRRADFFNPRAGWMTKLSSQKLPILSLLQLSAKRAVMRPRAIMTPMWVINAHSIVLVTRGQARVQVASDEGRTVHDGELRQGQLFVLPQNFVVLAKAGDEGFEWVAFKTNDYAIESQIAGKGSVFRGYPPGVISSAYRLPEEDAFRVKFGREEEYEIFPESSEHGGRPYAAM